MSKVSENIKIYRNRNGLKQAELGRLIGKAPSVIANWEAGTNRPDVDSIAKMCDIFKIDANTFFGWECSDCDNQYTNKEHMHMGRYRRLNAPNRQAIDLTIDAMLTTQDADKNSLINNGNDDPPIKEAYTRILPLHLLPASAGKGELLDSDDFELIETGPDVPVAANFGIRIHGNSMEPKYPDGHIAWVARRLVIDVGQIGVFVLNGEGLIKKLGNRELISLNPAYAPIKLKSLDDLRVCGIVVGVSENIY